MHWDPEKAKNVPLVCRASDLKAFALGLTLNSSASKNQTKTRTFESTAFWMNGAIVLSIFGSSICGVMKSTARFMPGCRDVATTVSNAIASVCKLGVVLRKSGLNDCRLTSQSLALAWLINDPDNETRLKSSCASGGSELLQALSVSTTRLKRGTPLTFRTASAGPGLTATTICTGIADSASLSTSRGVPSS